MVQLLTENSYYALRQLQSKKVGGSTGAPLQKVDFNYNIRGWLTEINKTANLQQGTDPKDLFTFKINYNTVSDGITDVDPLYNGNIAETFWKTGSDNIERGYGYQYDNLNRLKNAIYEKNGLATNAYDESLTYDKNGNILSLRRNGDLDPQIQTIETDNLAYSYPANSNQLSKVVDNSNNTSGFNDFNKTGDDYTYDVNGNMITDKNKNITAITYNHLNLPIKITFGTTGNISYFYNAAGQKVQKIVTETGKPVITTDYLDGFQYKDNILEFFPTTEGYVKNTSGALSYVFQYKDHLGNIRVSYGKNPITNVLEIIEESNYYPFGLKHKGYNSMVVSSSNKYKYNNKELQDELGLNVYDMEARNYMPDIGRWGNMDELAESFFDYSPYNFSNNNPIFFSDPSGLSPEASTFISATFINGSGKVVEHRNDGDDNVYLVDDDWQKGGSKKDLAIVGKEKPGMMYYPGLTYQFDENLELSNPDFNSFPKANGSATPIGGAFDLFGFWDAFYTQLFSEIGGDSQTTSLAFAVVTKGKIKPSTSIRALTGLLKAGKLHKHHVLSQQFRKWFASRGIKNIDDYTIQMSAKNHLKTLHGQGKWNQQWANFIKANPSATPSQIFYQAESMLQKYGLEHSRYVPYK